MSTFLNEMDGVDGSTGDGVLILGATNRPSIIDRALLRPGRFDRVIYVPPPDKSERRHILESQFLAWKSSSFSAEYFSSDDMTGYMTGAEIVGACREAAMLSVRDAMIAENDNSSKVSVPMILNHHLVESFKSVKPLLSNPEILAEYTSFESKNK
jgi:SpoVK/Ycf46/Vps4 family AAA+-type ATPase